MLLIHLSDIHFRSGEAGTARDPNQMLRARLIDDISEQCAKLGAASAILVSGDIAYAGAEDEYEFAATWLEQLAAAAKASLADVFVCPGNHDVDRRVARSPAIKNYHEAIRSAKSVARNTTVAGLLQDPLSNHLLMLSIQQYNSFAQRFFCSLTPEESVARRSLQLNDGSILRLWGLNSTLISGEGDAKETLIVDPSWNQILRKPGEENLVICHHPPSWVLSGDDFESHLNASVRLQLFGHEHNQRVIRDKGYLRVFAGAMMPERDALGWSPGYNLISLDVSGERMERKLEIKLYARTYQTNPIKFVAKMDEDGDVFMHSIALQAWEPPNVSADTSNAPVGMEKVEKISDVVDPMDSVREIGIRFFRLTLSQRASIAGRLKLLEKEDENRTDLEKYRAVFQRARDRQLVSQLEAAVKEEERKK